MTIVWMSHKHIPKRAHASRRVRGGFTKSTKCRICFFTMHSYPDTAKDMKEREMLYIILK